MAIGERLVGLFTPGPKPARVLRFQGSAPQPLCQFPATDPWLGAQLRQRPSVPFQRGGAPRHNLIQDISRISRQLSCGNLHVG